MYVKSSISKFSYSFILDCLSMVKFMAQYMGRWNTLCCKFNYTHTMLIMQQRIFISLLDRLNPQTVLEMVKHNVGVMQFYWMV